MNPALSVIFFSTLSGTGYGLWFWWASSLLGHNRDFGIKDYLTLIIGAVFVMTGLLSSTMHLGRKERAWRAFSQWRSSWLSREGVCAVLCFLPAGLLVFFPIHGLVQKLLAIALMLLCVVTVFCTAKIYHCLKTVPAWQHSSVLPIYLLTSLYTGGLWLASIFAIWTFAPVLSLFALILLWLMSRYWKNNDQPLAITRSSALGLPEERTVHVFENPHTEANYITKEMGHVLARKHSAQLRKLCGIFSFVLPLIALLLAWALNVPILYSFAAIIGLCGVFIGRWLFFAEAKHVVSLYY
ncbi:MAG: dimethyl sulfoxide reductase anchor subunit [Arenimonas sp.]|nr:dimethyl sulfoxide reductase anchor subunit [Arenimonas sp.]